MAEVSDKDEDFVTRAFPEAQWLIGASPSRRLPVLVDVGWHGTDVHPLNGATAVVRIGGPWDDELIGEVLRLTSPDRRSVFVLVMGARDVVTDISLARRAFLGLGLLSSTSKRCIVEVV